VADWSEYENLVLDKLKRLETTVDRLDEKVDKITSRLTIQEVKMGFIAAITSVVTAGAVSFALK
jgi:hypothetical protein